MSKLVKILVGIILIGIGAYTITLWWPDVLTIVRGGLGLLLVLAGMICFAILD